MLTIPPQRLLRRLRQRRRPLLALLLALFLFDALLILHARPRTRRVPAQHDHESGRHDKNSNNNNNNNNNKESVFVVSVHRNTGEILPAWSEAVLALVEHLGRDRVYFSALESGSQDDTKAKLAALRDQLAARGVRHTVALGMTVYQQLDEMWARPDPAGPRPPGWTWNPQDKLYDLRRITYLARERNRAMEPLWELERQGIKFDKVLWINDVVFDTEDVVTLLHTNDGNYAAACSMDFKYPSRYYDTFALRDDQGLKTVSNFFPWFLSPAARASALRMEPVRVEACWNGMVLFDAAPFYHADPLQQQEQRRQQPLRFRAIPDSLADLHLEASECCLVHADNPLSRRPGKGVWLNPNVRVAYGARAYEAVRGRDGEAFPAPLAAVAGAWANRWLGWRGAVQQRLEAGTVAGRLRRWRGEEAAGDEAPPLGGGAGADDGEPERTEPGVSCLVNEKQIMWFNGWKHL